MKQAPMLQVAANLLSLVIALKSGWPPAMILLLYWAENVVVAFWQVPRILLASGDKVALPSGQSNSAMTLPPAAAQPTAQELTNVVAPRLPKIANLFVALFFLVHYGLFTFAHGQFVFQLFLHEQMNGANLAAHLGGHSMALALLGLMVSHGVSFFQDLASGRIAASSAGEMMSEPYGRVVVLHLVVLGSAIFLSFLPYPQVGVVLLALVKTVMDLLQALKGKSR